MRTLLVIAWRNLWRGWRRSAIVLTAVAVGVAACLVMVGWSHGMLGQMADNAVSTRLAHLAVHATGYHRNPDVARNLPASGRVVAALAEQFPGAHASPRVIGDGLLQSARRNARVVLIGVDAASEARVSIIDDALVEGALPERKPDGARTLPGIAIGAAMAEVLRARLGDKLVVHAPGEAGLGAVRVTGIFRTASSEYDKSAAYLRLEDAQRLLGVPDRVTEVAIALDEPARLPELQEFVANGLRALEPGALYEVLTWTQREPRLAAMLALMANMSWIIYAAVFVAMAFGIANTLLMAVYERIREFGVLRSLGLPARDLLVLVMLESLLLTLFGCAVGLAVGVSLVSWLGATGIDMSRFARSLSGFGIGSTIYLRLVPADLYSPVWIAGATAVVAALWPAWKAMRLRPAEAVRHV